jgi:hypothetical protein
MAMTIDEHGAGRTSPSQTQQFRQVLGLFQALEQGDRPSIRKLSRDMTLEEGTLACFAIGRLLLRHLTRATGRSVEELAAQIAREMGSAPV